MVFNIYNFQFSYITSLSCLHKVGSYLAKGGELSYIRWGVILLKVGSYSGTCYSFGYQPVVERFKKILMQVIYFDV